LEGECLVSCRGNSLHRKTPGDIRARRAVKISPLTIDAIRHENHVDVMNRLAPLVQAVAGDPAACSDDDFNLAWDGTFDTHTTLEQVFVAETSRLHIHVLQRLRNVRRAPLKGSNQRWHINAVLARPNVLKTECSISLNHSSARRISA